MRGCGDEPDYGPDAMQHGGHLCCPEPAQHLMCSVTKGGFASLGGTALGGVLLGTGQPCFDRDHAIELVELSAHVAL